VDKKNTTDYILRKETPISLIPTEVDGEQSEILNTPCTLAIKIMSLVSSLFECYLYFNFNSYLLYIL